MTYSSVIGVLSGEKRFLEVNRGVLVNMDRITGFNEGECMLCSSIRVPISFKKKKSLEQTWQNYMFAVLRSETVRRN